MAQQTQVGRVVPYYERWIERWPTVAALADADPGDVLRAWVGLGYNVRALRLHETARIVIRDGWPPDAAGLRALPGVGDYTAAAVASFAFGERIAAVDTNVRRVAGRIGADPSALLPSRRHVDFNQAAMELGATVCTARAPHCEVCPAAPWCASAGLPARPPQPAPGAAGRFEDSDRWLRGRIVAALAADEDLPSGIEPERLARALEGLERDGLVERRGRKVGLPGRPR
jgi:A/G-specific adenine glycosylase